MKVFKYFGNDDDGFTIVDFLTVAMFLFFVFIKVSHILIILNFSHNTEIVVQTNNILQDVSYFTKVIILFYFSKKTIDSVSGQIIKQKQSKNISIINESLEVEPPQDESLVIEKIVNTGTFDKGMFNPMCSNVIKATRDE